MFENFQFGDGYVSPYCQTLPLSCPSGSQIWPRRICQTWCLLMIWIHLVLQFGACLYVRYGAFGWYEFPLPSETFVKSWGKLYWQIDAKCKFEPDFKYSVQVIFKILNSVILCMYEFKDESKATDWQGQTNVTVIGRKLNYWIYFK